MDGKISTPDVAAAAAGAASPTHAPTSTSDAGVHSPGHLHVGPAVDQAAANRDQTPPPFDSSSTGQENALPPGPSASAAPASGHTGTGDGHSNLMQHLDHASPSSVSPSGSVEKGSSQQPSPSPGPHASPSFTHTAFYQSNSAQNNHNNLHSSQSIAAGGASSGSGPSTAATTQVDPAFVGSSEKVASEVELEAFCKLPVHERHLTGPLRGVLAEAALTGRVRYSWPLLRPLVDFVLEQTLNSYEETSDAGEGPPKLSAYGGDSMAATIGRFKRLLAGFASPPWTLQRLCELLLEPRKQYSQLHKVVLALEKCLLVTSEASLTPGPLLPPLPALASLAPVNSNPAPTYQQSHNHHHRRHSSGSGHGGGRGHAGLNSSGTSNAGSGPAGQGPFTYNGSNREADESAAFTNSLIGPRLPHEHSSHDGGSGGSASHWAGSAGSHGSPVTGHGNGPVEHMEEDHWPDAGPLLHPVIGHHLPQPTSPSGLQAPLLLHAHSPPSPLGAGGAATSPTKGAAERHHQFSHLHRAASPPQQQHHQSPVQQQQHSPAQQRSPQQRTSPQLQAASSLSPPPPLHPQQRSPQQQSPQQQPGSQGFGNVVPSTPPPAQLPQPLSPHADGRPGAPQAVAVSPAMVPGVGAPPAANGDEQVHKSGDGGEQHAEARHPLLEVLEAAHAAGVPSSPVLHQEEKDTPLTRQQLEEGQGGHSHSNASPMALEQQ